MRDIPLTPKKEVKTVPTLSLLTVFCSFTPDGGPLKGGEKQKDDPPKKPPPQEDTSTLVPKKKKPAPPVNPGEPEPKKDDPFKGPPQTPPEVANKVLVDPAAPIPRVTVVEPEKKDTKTWFNTGSAPPIEVVQSGEAIADLKAGGDDEIGGRVASWIVTGLKTLGAIGLTDLAVSAVTLGAIKRGWTKRLSVDPTLRIARDTIDGWSWGYLDAALENTGKGIDSTLDYVTGSRFRLGSRLRLGDKLRLKDPILTYKLPAEADLIHSSQRASRGVDPRLGETPLLGTETVSFKGLTMILPSKITAREVVRELKRLENDTDFRRFLEDQIKEEARGGKNKERLEALKQRRDAYKEMTPEQQATARKEVIDEIFKGNECLLEAARNSEPAWRVGRITTGSLIVLCAVSYVLRGLANKQSDNPPPLIQPKAKPPG